MLKLLSKLVDVSSNEQSNNLEVLKSQIIEILKQLDYLFKTRKEKWISSFDSFSLMNMIINFEEEAAIINLSSVKLGATYYTYDGNKTFRFDIENYSGRVVYSIEVKDDESVGNPHRLPLSISLRRFDSKLMNTYILYFVPTNERNDIVQSSFLGDFEYNGIYYNCYLKMLGPD